MAALVISGAARPVAAAPCGADCGSVCGSVCGSTTDWCPTVDDTAIRGLRSQLVASLTRAQEALSHIIGLGLADPYQVNAQYNVAMHTNAIAAVDHLLAGWDLSTVSSSEGAAVQGTAQSVVASLDLAAYYATVSAIHFDEALEWQSMELVRALMVRFLDAGTRAARCYMAAYLPASCP